MKIRVLYTVTSALLAIILFASVQSPFVEGQTPETVNQEAKQVIERISEDSLRGHLSFIASDSLEGRATPSRGLDIAAEYIAAQFRRAGLEPAGDDGYFQTANWKQIEPVLDGFELKLTSVPKPTRKRRRGVVLKSSTQIALNPSQVTLVADQPVSIINAPVIRVDAKQLPKPELIAGKALLVEESGSMLQSVLGQLTAAKPLVVLVIDRSSETGRGLGRSRLIGPETARQPVPVSAQSPAVVRVHSSKLGPFVDALAAGETDARITIKLGEKTERTIKLKNVIGLLRGSDPTLKNTYVLLTAHYDHLGIRPDLAGDKIFNGANDDGSGTASVIEVAAAMARSRPKRSVVFMTFFGEEAGLLGSRYYGRNPVFPLKDTVADINLEQVGRTDSTEGSQVNRASLTGFDYSDLGPIFKRAGEAVGIEVYKHAQNSDAFFGRSDNQALADAGIPAHTLCVAFNYPDYHRAGDHWEKIDFPNFARTTRMVTLAIIAIANNDEAPKWNTGNPRTAPYVAAWQKLRESQ